jgi:DNA-binding transcriptional LysR family regulator
MDERELRAFLCVAVTGRMDRAAKTLGYSQPAISYQIKCLEQALGLRLFTRHSTGARLTSEGQMILPAARAAVMLIDEIRNTVMRPTQQPATVPQLAPQLSAVG